MKRMILVFSVVLVLILTSCGSQDSSKNIASELGIDVSSGEEITSFDNHGGFHGDGTTYIVLSFSDDHVLEQIENHNQWKKFPLDEAVRMLVYGISDETSSRGPFLTDSEGNALIPEIQNGYYFLVDRQEKNPVLSGITAEADILDRSSLNFTLALYDADTNMLYYCKYDS